MTDWLPASEVLRRLGVRPQTLYAYVSRGRIEARPDPADPRRSLYRASDVAGLAERKARGRKPADVARHAIAWGEPVLASAITTVHRGRLYYRGQDAVALSERSTLERVAGLLCGAADSPLRPAADPPTPAGMDARARAFIALAQCAAVEPPALGRGRSALLEEASAILRVLTNAIAGENGRGLLHQRLSRVWGCDRDGADLIRRALVLLADHELNASAFAARVAASTGASLSAACLAGLSALSGPRHGGHFARVAAYLAEAREQGAEAAVRQRLAQGIGVPGLDHPLYPDGDVRAQALLDAFQPRQAGAEALAAAEAVTGLKPNIDFALVLMADALGLPCDAPFALFAVARCAGWIAHALEQGAEGDLIRPRARYIGPPPVAGDR